MTRIALIQSADDLARYPYADTLGFVDSCCKGKGGEPPLLFHLQPVTVESVTEERLRYFLQSLDPSACPALVFATNALNSDLIWDLVQKQQETLALYLENGGGALFFQGNYRTPDALTQRLGYSALRRLDGQHAEHAEPTLRGADDVLLAYLDPVDFQQLSELRDG